MIGKLDDPATVQKLIADPSDNATQLLAILCWRHPHNQLETTSFDALEARGPKTTPLLLDLLKAARSTCTVRSTAHILARRKTEGLLDHLLRILPDDIRSFAMDMDIAGSLDELGDPRAVGPLVQVVDPANAEPTGIGPTTDRGSARTRRACSRSIRHARSPSRPRAGNVESTISPILHRSSLPPLTRPEAPGGAREDCVGTGSSVVSAGLLSQQQGGHPRGQATRADLEKETRSGRSRRNEGRRGKQSSINTQDRLSP